MRFFAYGRTHSLPSEVLVRYPTKYSNLDSLNGFFEVDDLIQVLSVLDAEVSVLTRAFETSAHSPRS